MDKNKFTTGLLAQVWRVDRRGSGRGKDAQLRLVHIEFRIEKARRVLQQIEQHAEKALEEVEQAQRRFEAIKDSFTSLQQEWRNWKNEQDNN
ncbi:MAG: hypothetical protein AAB538_00300 [Patescibacteria group bacterium]